MKMDEIRKSIDRMSKLPTIAVMLNKCSELMENSSVSASAVAEMISKDQSITSMVLRLVNSSFYGLPQKINSVNQAIVVLGFNTVRNLVLSCSVFDVFWKGDGSTRFSMFEFWKHSIGCAAVAKIIGSRVGVHQFEDAFIAGLLHDVGKIVLARYFRDDFLMILRIVQEKNMLFKEVEKQILGFTHAEIGGYLAKKWNLPGNLIEGITFHHTPSLSKNNTNLVLAVHLADIVCRGLGFGSGGDDLIPQLDTSAWNNSGLTMRVLEKLLPEIDKEIERASDFLSVLTEEENKDEQVASNQDKFWSKNQ